MKVIGITVLKKTLKVKENESIGNLPIYRKDLRTSVAFHVFTNQIVVVEIKNQRLYKIDIEQINVSVSSNRGLKVNDILFNLRQ
tara:strand:- start:225 stop:476 length:252 start_codon:yes stop_codon:yes gene_type:complete